jgi:hypothetical protein
MANSKTADRSAWWLAVVGAIGALAGAGITGAFNYLGQKSDLDAKLIELSVGVLQANPTPGTVPLRQWAIDVIQKRGNFNFDQVQQQALLKEALPFVQHNALVIGSSTAAAIQAQSH